MASLSPSKPILFYDGSCGFCTAGVDRWKNQTVVEVLPVQGGAGVPFGLPPDRPMGAIHLVESSGDVRRGASAVFRMMELSGDFGGGLLCWLYRDQGWFRVLADRGYAWVAARRTRLSAFCGPVRCPVGECEVSTD